MIFLKLGGSVITDKTREATAQTDVIRLIARQVKHARDANPVLDLLVGHGSGSFAHFAAKKYGYGRRDPQAWRAYAETSAAAARLNRIVADIFLDESIPVVTFQPSASAHAHDGALVALAEQPLRTALKNRLVPLIYGDVMFDDTRGMAIASTEMLFAYLAPILQPSRIVLAGIVDGVFSADPLKDLTAQLIRAITPNSLAQIESQLRGSHGVDVTGGMLAKVQGMVALVQREPGLRVHIIGALRDGIIERALTQENFSEGTVIHA